MRIVIDIPTGILEAIQLVAPDAKSQSMGFKAYQVLAEEINSFSKKAAKLLRLERALGRI
jgi:hypothetical protein